MRTPAALKKSRKRRLQWQSQEKRSWLSTVMLETWQEFLDAGGQIIGFREARWTTLRDTRLGDQFFFYIAGIARVVAIYEVISAPKMEKDRIWKTDLFPCRVGVQKIYQVEPKRGLPIRSLRSELEMFESVRKGKYWSAAIRHSLKRISGSDADLIEKRLRSNLAEAPLIPRHKINAHRKAFQRMAGRH